jgi:UDP-N-acetylglucosamine 2-epimerase (non-hydrolysing)
VHPNPAVGVVVDELLAGDPRVTLPPPLGYREMVGLLHRSTIVLTDSGGLREEACRGHPRRRGCLKGRWDSIGR